ncbi:MAG: 3-phosphoglycerate dehydrogenase [Oscillospiraceae bacterium]|jgi:D-3-phosphoglycerate dehydrogenase|nr:3-phosphoglycerate dehydrogenase [Oscillospiraceae bacterium]
MFHILTLNKISADGLSNFDEKEFTCADAFDAPDAVIVRSASMHEMVIPESVQAIARAGAGVNNIPVEDCTKKGIVVFNTPGANANAVKELVICAMLLASRRVVPAISWCGTLKGSGSEVGKLVEKGKGNFAGPEIKGKTLGLVGLGAIGILVANAAVDLGMKVIGYDPYLTDAAAAALKENVAITADINAVFTKSNYISLHAPATETTKGMINAEAFEKMKDGVRILNFARAELVNGADLLAALESGKCAAYATDFPSDEMLGVDGIIAIPHLGASTPESEENCAAMAVVELREFLTNGNIINSVNFPNVELAKEGNGNRLCVISETAVEEAILEALTGARVLAKAAKAKKAADTLVDTADELSAEQIEKVKAIPGVIKIRVI